MTSPYQIELADSEDKQKVLISMEIKSKIFGDTLSQLQEDTISPSSVVCSSNARG
jgi:hypothetical protein